MKYNLEKNVNKNLFLTKHEDKLVVIKNCGYCIGLLGVEDLHQSRQLQLPFKFGLWTLSMDPPMGPKVSKNGALLPLAHHPYNPPALPLSALFGDQ